MTAAVSKQEAQNQHVIGRTEVGRTAERMYKDKTVIMDSRAILGKTVKEIFPHPANFGMGTQKNKLILFQKNMIVENIGGLRTKLTGWLVCSQIITKLSVFNEK